MIHFELTDSRIGVLKFLGARRVRDRIRRGNSILTRNLVDYGRLPRGVVHMYRPFSLLSDTIGYRESKRGKVVQHHAELVVTRENRSKLRGPRYK